MSAFITLLFVGVPAVLWGLSVRACVIADRWRSYTFTAAVLLGGSGLFFGVAALTADIPEGGGLDALGAAAGRGFALLVGAGLLLVGALLGLVARRLPPRPFRPQAGLAELTTSPLEFVFDLVFVLAVVQTATVIRGDPIVIGVLRAALVFLMLWWAWSVYSWGTNRVGDERLGVRLALILATGLSLFMGLAVRDAFGEGGVRFSVSYALVLLLGLALSYVGVEAGNRPAALRRFLPIAIGGSVVFLIGGFFDPPAREIVWGVGVLVALIAASTARSGEFLTRPGRFASRQGMFIALAILEPIVMLVALSSTRTLDSQLLSPLGAVFLGAVLIWWLYFGRLAAAAAQALQVTSGTARTVLAAKVFTAAHVPIAFGIVLYTYFGIAIVNRPPGAVTSSWIFALAVALITLGVVWAAHRMGLPWLWERSIAALIGIAATLLLPISGAVAITAFVVLTAVAIDREDLRLAPSTIA